jgi:hypothetical protein
MKKKLLISLVMTSVINTGFAETVHCEPYYEGQTFDQATILSNTSGIGPAECNYKNHVFYSFPKGQNYLPSSGIWRSTMPGFQWCSVNDPGNSAVTCTFQLTEH